MAMCRAGAAAKDLQVYQHLAQIGSKTEFAIPVPWITAVEFKHEEIGEMLGIGPSTSRAKLSIARKKLKAIIQSSNKIYQYEAS